MPTDFPFKKTPFRHQLEDWERSRDDEAFGLFHEPGLGKSKITIDTAAWLYLKNKITAMLVVAPNGVHRNWVTDELPDHVPDPVAWRGLTWHSSRSQTRDQQNEQYRLLAHGGLAVLSMTYEGLCTDDGREFARAFLQQRRTLAVLDESTRIKSPSGQRARLCLGMADLAPYRRILTGTPAANGPFDVYNQVRFLRYDFWEKAPAEPIETYQIFEHRYGVLKRFQPEGTYTDKKGKTRRKRPFEKVVAYKNLDQLQQLLSTVSSRRLKEDVLDLPRKLYTKRYHDLTEVQHQHYQRLKQLFMTELESGEPVTAALAMVRLLRLQQVVCGYLPSEEEQRTVLLVPPDKNPRLKLLDDVVEETPHQAIIWARFVADVDAVCARLGPERAVRYDGQTTRAQREESLRRFHAGEAQFFVANPAAISMGVTLVEAKTVVYYSSDYSLEKRLQSEDRAHRIGQDRPVLYVDLVATGTVDEHIVRALQKKYSIAAEIQGDRLREWM